MAFGTFGVNGIKKVEPTKDEKDSTVELLAKKKKELDDLSFEVLGNVIDQITLSTDTSDMIQKRTVQDKVNETVNNILFETKRHLSLGDKQRVCNSVMDEIYGYGPITTLLNDPTVTEVMVNGPKNIFVERGGKITKTEHNFRDDRHVMHIIDKIISPLGRRVDESSPLVDARLPDGSRVNIIIPPLSIKGPSITIRKFSVDPYTLEDLISFGTLNADMAKLLRASVRGRVN
ncbi:MAG: ATPase, T2SS/T4P/T4SS family, partial [Bacillota bacterium]